MSGTVANYNQPERERLNRYRNAIIGLVGTSIGRILWRGIVQTARDGAHQLSQSAVQQVERGMNQLGEHVQNQVQEIANEIGDYLRGLSDEYESQGQIEDGDDMNGKSFLNLHNGEEALRFRRRSGARSAWKPVWTQKKARQFR